MAAPISNRAGRREWLGLAVIALPCVLYSMDLTVLELAVPRLSADLKPTAAQLLWILDIYGFLVAGSLITMGTLGDRIGRRKLLMIGAAAFGIASVIAAFSNSASMLIVTRGLLGIAGATLAPSTLSLIRNMFLDAGQRTVAIGVWVTSYSLGGAIGPILGGIVLEHFWWGAVFLIGVPVMLLLLLLGPFLLPEFRDPDAGRLDLLSAALSLAAVLSVIYGLKRIAEDGLEWLPVASIVVGVAVGIAFGRRQLALADPLIDLRLFRSLAFSGSLVVYMIGTFVAFGIYVFIAQYLQLVLGLSPLKAGLWTVPSMGAFIVGSMFVPVLVRRVRPPHLIGAGLVVAAIGFAILSQIDPASGTTVIVWGSVIYSLGISPVVILATDLIVGSAPVERAGAASAISETSSELGGALGIAILGSIGTAVYRGAMTGGVPSGVPSGAAAVAKATLGGAVAEAARLPEDVRAPLLDTARAAFGHAFEMTAAICAVVAIATAVVAMVLLRQVPTGESPAQRRRSRIGGNRVIRPLEAIGSLWMVWLVGWVLASLTAAKSVVRQSGTGRLVHGLLVAAGAILLLGRHPWLGPLLRQVYPASAWIGWTGVVLCAVGLAFAVWARVQIGRFWSGTVALKAEHALIRGGPYAITRHPIYSGLLLALVGTALTRDSRAAFLGLPFVFAGLYVKLKQEERLLLEHFGPAYEKYRAEVPALIPRL